MGDSYDQFQVQRGVRTSRSAQVAEHFRRRILAGELGYGEVLPPAAALAGASRMTVLHAYRELQREGLVRMQPSRGTVVIARRRPGSYALVLGGEGLAHGGRLNINQLLAALLSHNPPDRAAPRIYLLGTPAAPTDDTGAHVPEQLREDIEAGVIAGAFVWRPRYLPGVFAWLADRNVPTVCLGSGPEQPHVRLDVARAVAELLAAYHRLGLRRIEVWDTTDGAGLEQALDRRLPPVVRAALAVRWRPCPLDQPTVMATAYACVADFLAQPVLSEALLVTDDWVGLAAAHELAAHGVAVPARLRLGVLCNAGFIPAILHRCDRFTIDPDAQAMALHGLMARVVGRQPWAAVDLPLPVTFAAPYPPEAP